MKDPAISSIIGALIGALSSIIITILQNKKDKQPSSIIVPKGYKPYTPRSYRLWLIIILSILIGGGLGYGVGFVSPPSTPTPEITDLPLISTTEAVPITSEVIITDTFTVSPPALPAITITHTPFVLPDTFEMFDDFNGEGQPDTGKWNLTNTSPNCSEVQTGGYLLLQCDKDAASGTVFRFTPTETSYQQISGVAMAAQVQQQIGDSGGKIHIILRFNNDLSYIMSLRAIKVAVSELNNGASTTLKTQELDASQLHLLQIEYDGAGQLSFYIDNTLLVQANISPSSKLTSWSLEGEEQSAPKPRLEQAIIDWIAIKK